MGADIELENDEGKKDTFTLKPLNIKQIAAFQYLAKKEQDGELTLQDTEDMITLFYEVILNSYPELDKDIAENFAVNNLQDFMLIMNKLSPKQDERKLRQLQKMRKLQESRVKEDEGYTENTK